MGQSSHGRGVAPLDGTGLNVGVVVGAGRPFSNGPDEKLLRAVNLWMRQVVMVVLVVVSAEKTNKSWRQDTKRQQAS